jgi:hypothetical protein
MAYGLTAKTANDTFIIDGSSSNYRSLQPQADQPVSNEGTFGAGAGELVFAGKSSGSGGVYAQGSTLYGSNLRAFKAIPSNTFGSLSAGYGLRVFNQSGVLAYDSRNSAIGLEVVNIWAPGQLSGLRTGESNAAIDTGDVLYEGSNIHDYSILLNGSIFQKSGNYPSDQFSSQFTWNGAYYDTSTTPNRITWIGFASVNWFGSLQGGAVNNLQPVILAKYIA